MTGKDSTRGILVGRNFSFVSLFVSKPFSLLGEATPLKLHRQSQPLCFLALFLHVSECIATNAKSAKRPKQRPDSFVGKGVLPAENAVTWLRNIALKLKGFNLSNL